MPRRPGFVAPLSVPELQQASAPVSMMATEREAFEPPPPEDERKLRSSPEAARKRRTLPPALTHPRPFDVPPPPYESPARLAGHTAGALRPLRSVVTPDGDRGDSHSRAPLPTDDAPLIEGFADPNAPATVDDDPAAASAPSAPPPPPPAGGGDSSSATRFLASATSRPRGVSTDSFRLAVWSYSPQKKDSKKKARPSSAPITAVPNELATTVSSTARPPLNLNERLPHELIGITFSFLGISDLAVASQVCRGWFVAADPWAYTEQHGWVPLGPLTRAESVVLRVSIADRRIAPDLFRCLQHACTRLTLELGSSVAAASAAVPPIARVTRAGESQLSEDTPALNRLRCLVLERPSADDLRLLSERLIPRTPVLSELRVNRVSLPVGAREIVALLRGTKVRECRLTRVTNLTRATLSSIFSGASNLAVLRLDQCVFVADRSASVPSRSHTPTAPHSQAHASQAWPALPPSVAQHAAVSGAEPSTKFKVSATIVSLPPVAGAFKVLDAQCAPASGANPTGVPSISQQRRPGNRFARASGAAESAGGAGSSRQCAACLLQGFACAEHAPPPQQSHSHTGRRSVTPVSAVHTPVEMAPQPPMAPHGHAPSHAYGGFGAAFPAYAGGGGGGSYQQHHQPQYFAPPQPQQQFAHHAVPVPVRPPGAAHHFHHGYGRGPAGYQQQQQQQQQGLQTQMQHHQPQPSHAPPPVPQPPARRAGDGQPHSARTLPPLQ